MNGVIGIMFTHGTMFIFCGLWTPSFSGWLVPGTYDERDDQDGDFYGN